MRGLSKFELIPVCVLLMCVFAISIGVAAYTGDEILGVWIHETGPTLFESMEFTIEEEEHVFRSWLHDRPFAFGQWKIDHDVIFVTIEADNTIEWKVISVDQKQLRVRETGEDSDTIFRKD